MNINYFFSNLIRYCFNKFIHEEESFREYARSNFIGRLLYSNTRICDT